VSGFVSVLVVGVALSAAGAVAVRADRGVAKVVNGLAERPSSEAASPRRALLEGLGRTRLGKRVPRDGALARRLELAGSTWSLDALAGLKVALGFAFAGVGLLLGLAMPVAGVAIPVLAVAGYRGPDVALARRGRRRQGEIELRVPDLVELLVATTEAGLTPAVAFHRSSEVVGGPLGDELGRAVAEIDLGLSWRAAMERLVERTDVASLRRLVSAVGRSNRLGTSVQATLRNVAGDLRAERRARAEELARRAPVKMLFPLVFLILPAFLLLTVGPVVLATVHSLRSGG
jgi:tight adherence protein C